MNVGDYLFGMLSGLPTGLTVCIWLAIILTLGYQGTALWLWTVATAAALWLFGAGFLSWTIFCAAAVILNVRPLRRALITSKIVATVKRLNLLPKISATEKIALNAGSTWIDSDLFSGKPNFRKIRKEPFDELSAEEKAFINGPCEELCRVCDDWEVFQNREISKEAWDVIKREKFMGMIIPKEYGGLGFSALGHSEVIQKLASRSQPLAVSVMVPNSLGPAELLVHYGTKEQKDYYLPRLADGREIPCFALTEPNAGSDAGSIQAAGEVFRAEDGKIYIRLNWDKRYITLAAISTVLGLAFNLTDPDNLLGKGKFPGITCALIPTSTKGVIMGRRHDPLGVPFYNCPTQGENVVVGVDCIIGGPNGAGKGWKMLMESLAAGRGISLPGTATGGVKSVARVLGAYGSIRQQFGMSIGKFEGIEDPMANIGGYTYMLDAARRFTASAIDHGGKPPVVTAICKYHFTEIARKVVNDGMDISGGAGISRGPRNLLAHGYIGLPIGVTVEGANIMTRTLIHFGQGAIRCHPYAFQQVEALEAGDVNKFDQLFFGHLGHVFSNACRALLLSVTRGYLAYNSGDKNARYYSKLSWASASFALLADLGLGLLGPNMKRKGMLSGRYGDILSWMYLGTCVLRRYEAEGYPEADKPFVDWAMNTAFAEMQDAFDGVLANLDRGPVGKILAGPIRLWSNLNPIGKGPSDHTRHKVAQAIQQPGMHRDGLTDGIYIPTDKNEALGRLENAFVLTTKADGVLKKIKQAIAAKQLPKKKPEMLIEQALEEKLISPAEAELCREANEAREDAIQVDSFTLEEYLRTAYHEPTNGEVREEPMELSQN